MRRREERASIVETVRLKRKEFEVISLVRCDDRLIHGQCMTRIVQHFFIKEIFVVDDYTASNSILKSIFEKAVPPGMKAKVVSINEAIEILPESMSNDISTLVLFKTPLVAVPLFSSLKGLSDSMMVGPVAMKPTAVEMQKGTYLTPPEMEAADQLEEMGVTVYFQVVPGQKRFDWKDLRTKIKR